MLTPKSVCLCFKSQPHRFLPVYCGAGDLTYLSLKNGDPVIPCAYVIEIIHGKEEKQLLVHEEHSVLAFGYFWAPVCLQSSHCIYITFHR